ncbi:hypothetical protein BV280_15620, partial [Lactiplantibacillus plantarum]
YEEMQPKWFDIIDKWESDPNAFQFDSKKIKTSYVANLTHYFGDTQIPAGSHFETEKPVIARIGSEKQY